MLVIQCAPAVFQCNCAAEHIGQKKLRRQIFDALPKFEIGKSIRVSHSIEWKCCAGNVDVMQYVSADTLEIGGNNHVLR